MDLPLASSLTPQRQRAQRATTKKPLGEECILVLQGGGALGAYQAGVYESMCELAHTPDWVAGISIGAINAALIAGNPPARRVERLAAFWNTVSSACIQSSAVGDTIPRETVNESNAALSMAFGVPGFYAPRVPPAPFQPPGTPGAISYYDTAPLKQTLEELIDFDLLNSGSVRLSVGAVNVRTGNFAYFDTAEQRLDVRHIMASGALPPAFAPVEIDGEHYWDGGVVSNTPLQYVLDQAGTRARLVFQVDLFSAMGLLPLNLAEVSEREKDIRFSSRTRLNTTSELQREAMAQAVRRLIAKLPPKLRDDPDAKALKASGHQASVSVVHLIYRSKHYETQSKDYEFSRQSVQEHWLTGRTDTTQTLLNPQWVNRKRPVSGVHVFDLSVDGPSTAKTVKP
jgi:NTE family protein